MYSDFDSDSGEEWLNDVGEFDANEGGQETEETKAETTETDNGEQTI